MSSSVEYMYGEHVFIIIEIGKKKKLQLIQLLEEKAIEVVKGKMWEP